MGSFDNFISQGILIPIQIALLIIGIINCFWGYKLFRFFLFLLGFIVGSIIGYLLSALLGTEGITTFLIIFISGIICSILLNLIYFLGIFFSGAGLFCLIYIVFTAVNQSIPNFTALVIFAIVGGIVALIFNKFLIIISTSFIGSWSIVSSFFYIIGYRFNIFTFFQNNNSIENVKINVALLLLFWILLGIFGVLYQFGIIKLKGLLKNTQLLSDSIQPVDSQPSCEPSTDSIQTNLINEPQAIKTPTNINLIKIIFRRIYTVFYRYFPFKVSIILIAVSLFFPTFHSGINSLQTIAGSFLFQYQFFLSLLIILSYLTPAIIQILIFYNFFRKYLFIFLISLSILTGVMSKLIFLIFYSGNWFSFYIGNYILFAAWIFQLIQIKFLLGGDQNVEP